MEDVLQGMFFARQGWYPEDSEGCRRQVQRYVEERKTTQGAHLAAGDAAQRPGELPESLPGRAGVVPHAGWAFSGALAAWVFDALSSRLGPVDTVVLLGGHLGPRSPGWVISSGTWPTPLGDVPVDETLSEALAAATDLPSIGPRDYEPDNTVELQLPLVRFFFPESRLVAAGVPAREGAEAVGREAVIQAARLGRSIVVVGSTDLTHYGPSYGFEPAGRGPEAVRWVKDTNDARAVELMVSLQAETLRSEALRAHFLCCPGATAAALGAAKEAGAESGHVLDRLTSYDIRPGASFVGYAAVVF